MTIARLGESALILKGVVSFDKLATLKEKALNLMGVQSAIPSYESLTVHYCLFTISFESLSVQLLEFAEATEVLSTERVEKHEVLVCYDLDFAPDLSALASYCGMSVDEVVGLHSSVDYRVAAIGFSPGFGFLAGLPEELHCPRLDAPRAIVTAGSVGIAGTQTGVYPLDSAGGWNLIGMTSFPFVNYSAEMPSRLKVGDTVTFKPVTRKEL